MHWEGRTYTHLTGVIGEPETPFSRGTITEPFSPERPETAEVLASVGERFGYQITRKNASDVLSALEGARVQLAASRPVRDERITPDEHAQAVARIQAIELERQAGTAITDALRDECITKMPAGAKALIVAQYVEDSSDSMSDYFANVTRRVVAIGWRFTAREDFARLRTVAGTFVETEHLSSDEALTAWQTKNGYRHHDTLEHRDNYSMGQGNYLSDHGWDGAGTGWVVRSYPVKNGQPFYWPTITEVHLPEPTSAAATATEAKTNADGVVVRPSSIGREGVVEVVFPTKPTETIRAALKAHGFRWARTNACWYGRDADFANQLLAGGAS